MIYLKIFFGKMIDVTLGTLVTIYIVKNKKIWATIIGFIDVFIWLLVVNTALKTTNNNFLIALTYSFGYAFGTYLGSYISNIFNNDIVSVQIVTKNKNNIISDQIKKSKYSASMIECTGLHKSDKKYIIYAGINNKELNNFIKLIKKYDNNSFITISENKEIIGGFISK